MNQLSFPQPSAFGPDMGLYLAAAATAGLLMAASAPLNMPKPIERLGTADFSMVEATPVVWKGQLLRFESVRGDYGSEPNCSTCGLGKRDPAMLREPYYRFRNVVTLETTASFASTYSFGCAFVLGDTMWAFGRGGNSTQIGAFSSTDLVTWTHSAGAAQLGGFGHAANDYEVFNNNVHNGRNGSYIMAVELMKPSDIAGTATSTVFMVHHGGRNANLSTGWTFLDPRTHVWPPITTPKHGYAGACPTVRYVADDDYYYLTNLHGEWPIGFGTYVIRSRNLTSWESSKANPMLDFSGHDANGTGNVLADKGTPPRGKSELYYANFSAAMEEFIAGAEDINNSDIDYVDFTGDVYITYSWGNQVGTEFLGAAVVRGTTTDTWLQSYF